PPQPSLVAVGPPARQAQLVAPLEQQLPEATIARDPRQLEEPRLAAAAQPLEERRDAVAGTIGADQRRAEIAVQVPPDTHRADVQVSEARSELHREQTARSPPANTSTTPMSRPAPNASSAGSSIQCS